MTTRIGAGDIVSSRELRAARQRMFSAPGRFMRAIGEGVVDMMTPGGIRPIPKGERTKGGTVPPSAPTPPPRSPVAPVAGGGGGVTRPPLSAEGMARLHQLTGAKMAQAAADGAFEVTSAKDLTLQAPHDVGGGVVMPIEVAGKGRGGNVGAPTMPPVAATGRDRANDLVGGGAGGAAPVVAANVASNPDAMTPEELKARTDAMLGRGRVRPGVFQDGNPYMLDADERPQRGPARDFGSTAWEEANTGMKVGSPEAKAHAEALARHRTGDIYGYSNRAADLRASNRASGFGVSRPIGRRKDELQKAKMKAGAVERVRREEELTKRGNNQRTNEAREHVSDNQKAISENEMKNQLATLRAQLRIAQLTGATKEAIAELQRRIAAITKYLNGGGNAGEATASAGSGQAVNRQTNT